MIKFVSRDFKDIKIGSKQVVKVMQGIDVVWEKKSGTLVYSDTGRSSYDIRVYSGSDISPKKNYKFISNRKDLEYFLVIGDKEHKIKTGDIFTVNSNCNIKIRNNSYGYFDIKLYETQSHTNLIIDVASGNSENINNDDSIKQITFESISDMSPYTRQIPLTKVLSDELNGKGIFGIYINGFKEITGDKAEIGNYNSIWLTNSLDELIGATDFIKKGTKITIKYK